MLATAPQAVQCSTCYTARAIPAPLASMGVTVCNACHYVATHTMAPAGTAWAQLTKLGKRKALILAALRKRANPC